MGLLILQLFWLILSLPCTIGDECEPIQYLEYGEMNTLRCSFGADIYSVIWYDSVDYITTKPIAVLQEHNIIDDGGLSDDYNITLDGSLIINAVSLIHEHEFVAVLFEQEGAEPSLHYIDVVVTVTPYPDFPVIDICGNSTSLCFTELKQNDVITCSVQNARPKVSLQWLERTETGDSYIETQTEDIMHQTLTFSSYSTLNTGCLTSLSLFVCKVFSANGLLAKNESEILIQHGSLHYETMEQEKVILERNSKLVLQCGNSNAKHLVWRKLSERYITTEYAVATSFGGNRQTTTSGNFEVSEGGAMRINQAQILDSGLYACSFSDGTVQYTSLHNVLIYVNPNPSHPVVDGCSEDKYCVIEAQTEGALSCSLFGVSPVVDLSFRAFYPSDKSKMSFFEKLKVTNKGETFDIVLTATYELHGTSDARYTIECGTQTYEDTPLDWSKKFDLILISDPVIYTKGVINTEQPTSTNSVKYQLPFITALVGLGSTILLIMLLFIVIYQVKKRQKQKQNEVTESHNEEMEYMIPQHLSDEELSAKKSVFLQELRVHYEQLCQTICPIPFMKENLFSVNDLYVEGAIEISTTGTRGRKVWKRLKSYHEILNKNMEHSKMRVIFGDPGYGKSTLGIQLVHDWCKRVVSSPLTNIEFVIFIRFRQLGSIKSLFEAIKLFLLPIDSELSVKDIASIIRRSKSTLVIFDGYDEIDEKANFLKSDIKSIIERAMLQNLQVIVTTRTHCFPNEVASASLYIRLNGFDNEDRRNYIKKAIVAGDTNAADDILQRLQQNPIHGDICEVPLLFVMYAHITHERGTDLKFDSVTSFFRYMISCFHNHLRNKYSNDHNARTSIYETDHSQLDEAAFDWLTGDKHKTSWSKADFLSKLGTDFYEHYLRVGILIEEEILSFDDKYDELSSEVINRKIVVRFFHNLVCEWYAAHYLAKIVKFLSESKLRKILKNLHPFNLQYIYRFACGINSDAADLIIQYLNSFKDGEKLAILCLLEKSGTVDNIKETVTQLCVDTIYISSEHSRLLQRSTMQLIDIAFRVQIPIKCIDLEKCVDSVDPSQRKLTLTSGLKLQSLKMVKELKITERGRELTYDEVTDIFKYSVICEGLERLTFECCLLPENSGECLFTELEKKEVLVQWNPTAQWFQLDQDGKWKQENGTLMSNDDYKAEVLLFREEWSDMPWQLENKPFQENQETLPTSDL